ncbi:polysaccharide deacetylase family protein [Paraglaciecola sp.]|uniref:polysaccharide deacetylase family protein n=1 Tax=Paraglaciecola sp. TaxID=1920173 RepID=UPI00273EDEA4|nr:polysaccharide deacetylase family protein [Paraglaciecola sp.]MDP5031315.1 polysaccharide deacetylase family protein [Paraglaciecola sp.]
MKNTIRKIIEKTVIHFQIDKLLLRLLPNGLYVFNFHRIGSKQDSEFARDVFSCSEAAFEKIIIDIKQNFRVITTNELAQKLQFQKNINERLALITFDDGYIDNYTVAYPILKKHEVTALFFLSTSLINSRKIAWWDEITFMLRRSVGNTVTLPDNSSSMLLDEHIIESQIQHYIQNTKRQRKNNIPKVLAELHIALPKQAELLENTPSLFMSWQNIKTMTANKMEIGSHTVSHQILTSLTEDEQEYEITRSKHIIEEEITSKISAFAYPVGSSNCYNETSKKLCQKAGYLFAFNNQSGINKTLNDPFNLYRICIDNDNLHKFRFKIWINRK